MIRCGRNKDDAMLFGILYDDNKLLSTRPFASGEVGFNVPSLSYSEPVQVVSDFFDAPTFVHTDKHAMETLLEEGEVLVGSETRDLVAISPDIDRSRTSIVAFFNGLRRIGTGEVITLETRIHAV